MGPAKRTLAIFVLTTTIVGCSSTVMQVKTPTKVVDTLKLYTTTATHPLVVDATIAYTETQSLQNFEIHSSNYRAVFNQLQKIENTYFITTHLPINNTLWAAPIGQDGLTLIANQSVNLDNLTIEQLRLIYRGQVTNWQELGANQQDIIVFNREQGSGTGAEFSRLVMGYYDVISTAQVVTSNQQMVEYVAQSPGSIGYVSMAYITDEVNVLKINNVLPSRETVANNIYPLRSIIYVVGLSEPQGNYRKFIAWLQSPEGQNVINQQYARLYPILQG